MIEKDNRNKYQKDISESIQNKGIFSYPKEVQSLVIDLYKKLHDFREYKDPKLLPLFRKAIFDTHDKYILVAYNGVLKGFTRPESIERRLRMHFNRCIDNNTYDGIFLQDEYMDEIETKIKQNYLPELNESLQKWFEKYRLKKRIKETPPNLKEVLNAWDEDSGQYEALYSQIDRFLVVSCQFKKRPKTNGFGVNSPNRIVTEKLYFLMSDSMSDSDGYPTFLLENILFISKINIERDLSKEHIEFLIKREIQELVIYSTSYWRNPQVSWTKVKLKLDIDDLPDRSFIRIILFEESYQKEFLYTIVRRYKFLRIFIKYPNFKINSVKKQIILKKIYKVVPQENIIPLFAEVEKSDLRFDF